MMMLMIARRSRFVLVRIIVLSEMFCQVLADKSISHRGISIIPRKDIGGNRGGLAGVPESYKYVFFPPILKLLFLLSYYQYHDTIERYCTPLLSDWRLQ